MTASASADGAADAARGMWHASTMAIAMVIDTSRLQTIDFMLLTKIVGYSWKCQRNSR